VKVTAPLISAPSIISTSPPLVVYIPKVTGPTLVDKDKASVLFSLSLLPKLLI
jgi:hypothetical protein